jgi:hypothetical protein
MVECLTLMTGLELLLMKFQTFLPRLDGSSRRLPSTSTVLPVLSTLIFHGVHDYLYQIFAHINSPRLKSFLYRSSAQPSSTSHKFPHSSAAQTHSRHSIKHTYNLAVTLQSSHFLHERGAPVAGRSHRQSCAYSHVGGSAFCPNRVIHSRLSSPTHIASMSSDQMIYLHQVGQSIWVTPNGWLFLAFSPPWRTCTCPSSLCYVLDPNSLTGNNSEVLPALRHLFIERPELNGSARQAISKFVAARQWSGHPVIVQGWVKDDIDDTAPRPLYSGMRHIVL